MIDAKKIARLFGFDEETAEQCKSYYDDLQEDKDKDINYIQEVFFSATHQKIKNIARKYKMTEQAVIDLIAKSIDKNKRVFIKKIFKSLLPKKEEVKKDYNYYQHHHTEVPYILVPNSPIINYLNRDKINMFKVAEFDIYSADWDFVIEQKNASGKVLESLKMSEASPDQTCNFTGFSTLDYWTFSLLFTAIKEKLYFNAKKDDAGNLIFHLNSKTLWEIAHPHKDYRDASDSQRNMIKFMVCNFLKKSKNINGTYYLKGNKASNSNYEGYLLMRGAVSETDNLITVKVAKNGIIGSLINSHSYISIPSKMLAYGTSVKNNDLARFYIAKRIRITSKKMKKSITCKTLDQACYYNKIEHTDKAMLKKWMQFLVDEGYIGSFTFGRHGISWTSAEKKQKTSPVLMHDQEGKIMKDLPSMPEDVKTMEANVVNYNSKLRKYRVYAGNKKLDCTIASIYCRGDYNCGGRLYTGVNGHQALSKVDRANITINEHATTELDFSALHPSMIYADNGIQLEADPYSFCELRDVAKKALLIAINAKNKEEAVGALNEYIRNHNYSINANDVYSNMEKHHAEIKDYFYSDYGVKLQKRDGKMMMEILNNMLSLRIIALPVHDSIIIDSRYADKAKAVMDRIYRKYNNDKKINIK